MPPPRDGDQTAISARRHHNGDRRRLERDRRRWGAQGRPTARAAHDGDDGDGSHVPDRVTTRAPGMPPKQERATTKTARATWPTVRAHPSGTEQEARGHAGGANATPGQARRRRQRRPGRRRLSPRRGGDLRRRDEGTRGRQDDGAMQGRRQRGRHGGDETGDDGHIRDYGQARAKGGDAASRTR